MARKRMHRHQDSCNVVNHQGQRTTERGYLYIARCRAFARHPLCRVLENKKGIEERNGRGVGREEREREREKKKKKAKKKHKQINFEQNNILSLLVNRV